VVEEGNNRGKFIGLLERHDYGWRASFRTQIPGEVFSQQGGFQIFGKEAEAMKWLHTQASNLGYVSIDIRRK
jgi:hypothetical protein